MLSTHSHHSKTWRPSYMRPWRPRVHTPFDYNKPELNNFENFKLQNIKNKGIGVICVKTTPSKFNFVGQYPNLHATKPTHSSNMSLAISTKNKPGLWDWTSVDPKNKFKKFSNNFDRYLSCRINEPNEVQSFEGKRFHPNCGWRNGECLETKEVWQEFWTLRKIYKGEELTLDYGYPHTYKKSYKTAESSDPKTYEAIMSKHRRKLNDLGPISRVSGATVVKSKNSSIDIVRQHGLDFKKLNKRLALKKLDTRSMKEVLLHEDCLGNQNVVYDSGELLDSHLYNKMSTDECSRVIDAAYIADLSSGDDDGIWSVPSEEHEDGFIDDQDGFIDDQDGFIADLSSGDDDGIWSVPSEEHEDGFIDDPYYRSYYNSRLRPYAVGSPEYAEVADPEEFERERARVGSLVRAERRQQEEAERIYHSCIAYMAQETMYLR